MGKTCFGCFKSWRTKCYFVMLLVIIVESKTYGPTSSETEFEGDYVDEGTLQKIKNAVKIASDRTSFKDHRYTYSYSEYEDDDEVDNSLEIKPVRESYEKHTKQTKHAVIVKKPLVPTKVHKSQPISKEMALMIMLALKALVITMLSLGLPALIGLYALILTKTMMGLKTLASTNAFTLGVLSTKYLQNKQDSGGNLQQAASLLPFYAPLLLSSLVSSASLITGAVGLIGSLFSNSTTTNSTTTAPSSNETTTTTARTTTTTRKAPSEELRRIEVLHLPTIDDECEPKKRKKCKVPKDQPLPPQSRFSKAAKRATQTVKDFWKRVSTKFKII